MQKRIYVCLLWQDGSYMWSQVEPGFKPSFVEAVSNWHLFTRPLTKLEYQHFLYIEQQQQNSIYQQWLITK